MLPIKDFKNKMISLTMLPMKACRLKRKRREDALLQEYEKGRILHVDDKVDNKKVMKRR